MRAHFAPIKLKTKRMFSLTASCTETSETCTQTKLKTFHSRSSMLKCTDESSLVALGKYLFLAAQIRKKRLESDAYPL